MSVHTIIHCSPIYVKLVILLSHAVYTYTSYELHCILVLLLARQILSQMNALEKLTILKAILLVLILILLLGSSMFMALHR